GQGAFDRQLDEFGDHPPKSLVVAIECLGEVRNLQPLETVGTQLLDRAVSLLDGDRLPLLTMLQFHQQILPAFEAIGTRWPGRDANRRSFFARRPTASKQGLERWWFDVGAI